MRSLGSWFVLVSVVSGCTLAQNGGSSGAGGPTGSHRESFSGSRPALSCAPQNPAWSEVELLYSDTEDSVHELITCGGLQVSIATNIVLMLIANNEDLFKQEERAYLDGLFENPFTHAPDGSWTMELSASAGSSFTLSFYDPDSGELVTDDVFDLDSFLAGVHIQTAVGFDEMLVAPSTKHDFEFTWEAEGPLAHLMNGGEPLPDGFTLQLSLTDFLSAAPSDLGPFESVFALEVESLVHYFDERSGTTVEYEVAATRDALSSIARSQSLGFEVERIAASAGGLALEGDTQTLSFVRLGALAGQIDYSLSGRLGGEDVHILVESDFGLGAAYPETEWSCPAH